jgi:hypothetical protein
MLEPMREPRLRTDITTTFELGGWRADGRIENAASGGVFVQTSTIPEKGEKVWLRFEGSPGEPVEATGVVWWTTLDPGLPAAGRQGFGVRLVTSSDSYRKLLARLARER